MKKIYLFHSLTVSNIDWLKILNLLVLVIFFIEFFFHVIIIKIISYICIYHLQLYTFRRMRKLHNGKTIRTKLKLVTLLI